ncbi:hypothetical protein B0O99DRAFT_597308 [Bisporella sp. PMI_857]|nr:hypothetical protein B0O99DRAFT_597308 [Bisporella sp. PMI_857]
MEYSFAKLALTRPAYPPLPDFPPPLISTPAPPLQEEAPVQPFAFLALPIEIRLLIYRLLLLSNSAISYIPSRLHPAILATCRQINSEAREVLYGENTFWIGVTSSSCLSYAIHFPRTPWPSYGFMRCWDAWYPAQPPKPRSKGFISYQPPLEARMGWLYASSFKDMRRFKVTIGLHKPQDDAFAEVEIAVQVLGDFLAKIPGLDYLHVAVLGAGAVGALRGLDHSPRTPSIASTWTEFPMGGFRQLKNVGIAIFEGFPAEQASELSAKVRELRP